MLEKMRKSKESMWGQENNTPVSGWWPVLLKKHVQEKLDLKGGTPNYRIIRLPTAWIAVTVHTVSGRTRKCNVGDLQKKHSHKDWQLKASNVGTAAKFVNHPSNLPEVEYAGDKPDNCDNDNNQRVYITLGSHQTKTKTGLVKATHNKRKKVRYIKQKPKNRKTSLKILLQC